jgi:hypothetical protein
MRSIEYGKITSDYLAFPVYDIGAIDSRVIRALGDRNKINNIMKMVIFIQRNERGMVNVLAMGMRRQLLGLILDHTSLLFFGLS